MNKILCLTVVLLLSACGPKDSSSTVEQAPAPETTRVVLSKEQLYNADLGIETIQKRALSSSVHVTGMLDVPPQNQVDVTAPLGGFLRSTVLLQGMKVSKGQVIAVVENPEYIQLQQDFLDSKSQLKFLESEYGRQEQLARENVNAQKTLQKSMADLNSSKAKNDGLRAKLKMLGINPEKLQSEMIASSIELRSPIQGFVTHVNASIGAYIGPTEVMFKLVDTDHVHAELICFERDLPKIKIGQKIRFTLANEGRERSAHVFLIGKEISEDRSVRIHGHLDEEDQSLIPGMYLKATIETGSTEVNALPEDAVLVYEDKRVIFVQESDNVFQLVEVNVGVRDSGFIEVLLPQNIPAEKARVVARNAYKLLAVIKNKE